MACKYETEKGLCEILGILCEEAVVCSLYVDTDNKKD